MQPIWAVGLMTGTVLDGNIDVAILRSDGETIQEIGAYELVPYSDEVMALLRRALAEAQRWDFTGPEPAVFTAAEEALTRAQSAAVHRVVTGSGLRMADIGIVGFHGQTVLHRGPAPGRPGATRQLGAGQLMADLLGADVAYDFRSADVAAGGQGAPLAPIYHQALLKMAGAGEETAVLNLGGVGNITWIGKDGQIAAFDTGPANAPINDFMRARGAGDLDRNGFHALGGKVDEARLKGALQHPYLARPFPKSLDRFDFGFDWIEELDLHDGAATLTAFSAAAVGAGLDILPRRPARLVVCGGGRHNPAMMQMIERRAGAKPVPAEALGWRGDAIEAECFAFLAIRSLRGLPISFPGTTGAPKPLCGGVIARAPGKAGARDKGRQGI